VAGGKLHRSSLGAAAMMAPAASWRHPLLLLLVLPIIVAGGMCRR
jgi:hypothetical protein